MVQRGWGAPLVAATGVAALAGAAQLGVAYGLGILLWAKRYAGVEHEWTMNLTWVCWLAAVSAVGGALAGGWLSYRPDGATPMALRAAIALAAGIGALLTVPLVAVPARYAEITTLDPSLSAGRAAVVGVFVGVVIGFAGLAARPLGWNTLATVGWLWLVTLTAVVSALRSDRDPDTIQLGVWAAFGGTPEPGWARTLLPMLASAVLIGALIAWLARRRGHNRVAAAVCGAPGPLLVAAAYLTAGPGDSADRDWQLFPYLAVPYSVIAGLLGSLVVIAVQRPETPDVEAPPEPEPAEKPDEKPAEKPDRKPDRKPDGKPDEEPPARRDTEPMPPPSDDDWPAQLRDRDRPKRRSGP